MSADDGSAAGADAQASETTREDDNVDVKSEEEAAATLKRKALSPSPAPEEAPEPKRTKIVDGASPNGTPEGNVEETSLNGSGNGHSDKRREETALESPARVSEEEYRRPSVPAPDRRRDFSREEKKRGQRLFGGLLSTLSQTTSNSQQQKKRLEIERRQQERVRQQKIEDDKRHADRLAKLTEIRKIEQVKFDEQVMHTRHSSMLAMAKSLQTRSHPKIYYLPWERTEEQDAVIKDQIRDAEETIDKELADFKREKERRLQSLGVYHQPALPKSMVGEPRSEHSNTTPADSTTRPSNAQEKDHDERDIMVETEEDTVIY